MRTKRELNRMWALSLVRDAIDFGIDTDVHLESFVAQEAPEIGDIGFRREDTRIRRLTITWQDGYKNDSGRRNTRRVAFSEGNPVSDSAANAGASREPGIEY